VTTGPTDADPDDDASAGAEPSPTAADRLRWLGSTASRWIVPILLLVVAVLVGVSWTFGVFTSTSANARNTVTAGSMTQDNTAGNAAIMQAAGMVPGDVVTGSATIVNVGDTSGDFSLRVKGVTDTPGPNGGALSSRLTVAVYDTSSASPLWSGPLRDLQVGLGTWQPGEERTYRFEVTLPQGEASVDNTFQRSSTTATFEWNATQTR